MHAYTQAYTYIHAYFPGCLTLALQERFLRNEVVEAVWGAAPTGLCLHLVIETRTEMQCMVSERNPPVVAWMLV